MNQFFKAGLVVALSIIFCNQAMAAFSLNGTRFIYEGGRKNISFEVSNSADQTYGGQVWINNTNQGDGVYFIPQPPFFKVGAKQKQIVRIMSLEAPLPQDRESLFWLNVQEVPPKPEAKDDDAGMLAIAMNTQVKLIYRPTSIKNSRRDAEKKLKVEQRGGSTWLHNPTPYYFAIVKVTANGKEIPLNNSVHAELSQLKPFSTVSLNNLINGKISIDAINDWGGVQHYEIH